MGNNPSKGPAGDAQTPSGHSGLTAPASDKRVHRRPSVNASSGTTKASAADPPATRETAKGYATSQSHHSVQQRLQSRNVADSATRTADRPTPKKADLRDGDIPSPDPSNPVQVPVSRATARNDPMAPSGAPPNVYYSASVHLQRPPRMPLPIGDATTVGREDGYMESLPVDQLLDEHIEQRHPSQGSTTVEDDEILDELQPFTPSGVGRAVPTTIEWTGPGDKVYVTGTFVNWEKKFRLHRSENNPGVMSARLNLRPGTHHLKFIVDNEMRASDTLPTAVDFTNHLVNYIEISADDINRGRRESDKGSVPPGIRPPQVLPDPATPDQEGGSTVDDQSDKEEPEEEIPLGDFRGIIPQFLLDLDKEEEAPEYQQAVNIVGDAPTPPSLPLFLGKSILNGTTPMKDDSSVLNYPNHTVLNHLATSSIKNGVLATSVTTRYKRKYVTTILYKPTGDISE
ncbi:putative Snf1 kinase complex beta-subunit Gal83 [Aspergillus fijiensis CBS 313.89]|uniref:Snf1 kinase complex beta-subunit Gal83 n=1 Tax=Aspergillus fijiensis CBS 313.89 TaxID=1448319 RepID=A0A8G1W432_9EURO|nr:Snf1 kinase complex beta-subunit Gal83 [Aspergillus fijiensis CBS 313.89]RAK79729.1 Snf1 kinase complex beta-subunit Gal83 [Aspergillus fijiensis CBS 313.89]